MLYLEISATLVTTLQFIPMLLFMTEQLLTTFALFTLVVLLGQMVLVFMNIKEIYVKFLILEQ